MSLSGKGDAHAHLGVAWEIFETPVTGEWTQKEKRPSDFRHPQRAVELNDDTAELVDPSDLVNECNPPGELVRPFPIESRILNGDKSSSLQQVSHVCWITLARLNTVDTVDYKTEKNQRDNKCHIGQSEEGQDEWQNCESED